MIESIMRSINNFFERAYYDGTFTITRGVVILPEVIPQGTLVAVTGSMANDGVYAYGIDTMDTDEVFTGRVWILHPPRAFLELCDSIAEYNEKTPVTGFQSESFGEYSYTRASGSSGVQTWQEAFRAQLMPYYRMFTEVRL